VAGRLDTAAALLTEECDVTTPVAGRLETAAALLTESQIPQTIFHIVFSSILHIDMFNEHHDIYTISVVCLGCPE